MAAVPRGVTPESELRCLKALDPTLAPKRDDTYNSLMSGIKHRLAIMNLLEVAESERLKAEGCIARRAELSAWQGEIEST